MAQHTLILIPHCNSKYAMLDFSQLTSDSIYLLMDAPGNLNDKLQAEKERNRIKPKKEHVHPLHVPLLKISLFLFLFVCVCVCVRVL